MTIREAVYAIDEGRVSISDGAVIGSFYAFVVRIGLNKRRQQLRWLRNNQTEFLLEHEPDKASHTYEENEHLLVRVEAILNHFRSVGYGGVNGYDILKRLFYDDEPHASVEDALGLSRGNLASWLYRQNTRLRLQHARQEQ